MFSSLRPLSRRTRLLAGVSLAGTTTAVVAGYYITTTDSGRGVRRQAFFWSRLTPVIADYYFRTASSSPYVRFRKWQSDDNYDRTEILQQLHTRHSHDVFETMLMLKGLYVKLGQVLSVTALPIPEEYRVLFRTLQSDVPGYEEFEQIQSTIESDFGQPLESIFSSFERTPVGAASIGQAHKAVDAVSGEDVIVKIQYPDAAWQVPSDIQCVGDLLKICVWTGVVDETAANLSFREFSRQFLAELDYRTEAKNLRTIYESSLQSDAPYIRRNVVVPKPFMERCTDHVITMEYLPGPKLEEEARRQLKSIGINIDSSRQGLRDLVARDAQGGVEDGTVDENISLHVVDRQASSSWRQSIVSSVGKWIGMDTMLWLARLTKSVLSFTIGITASTVQATSYVAAVPSDWKSWADEQMVYRRQSRRVEMTEDWIHALFDVHGHQIFQLGLFNADAHPGNILVVEKEGVSSAQLGLIDFGQCKRLGRSEQIRVARLLLAVANKDSDEHVAECFRALGVKTKRNSTSHLAKFARLMFGRLESQHLDHKWHRELHEEDSITYFPNELGMVYRTSMLLRGLALSLQMNVSVADEWREYAEKLSSEPLPVNDEGSTTVETYQEQHHPMPKEVIA